MACEVFNGKYPPIYVLEEHGEEYMLGSEVGTYLGYYKGALYKRYPSLHRRILTSDERQVMSELNIANHRALTNMGTMVVRAKEAMDIMTGKGDRYRRKDTHAAAENNKFKEAINVAFCRAAARTKDLPNLRENLSFLPGAKERANSAAERRKLRQETYIETNTTRVLGSNYNDYTCPDSTVMNSVSFIDPDVRKSTSHAKKKSKKKEEETPLTAEEKKEFQERLVKKSRSM